MDGYIVLMFFIGIIGNFIGTIIGGGGLITLPIMIIFNVPIQSGIGINKFSTGVASFTNIIYLWRYKLILLKNIILIALIGSLGGIIGSLITSNLNEAILKIVVVFLLIFALFLAVKSPLSDKKNEEIDIKFNKKNYFEILLVSIYNGGFGPGSSTLGIISFMRQGITYLRSAHLTRILSFGSNLTAFLIYNQLGFINWSFAIPLTLGAIIGSRIGLKFLPIIPQALAKKLLIGVTILLLLQVAYKLIV